MDGDKESFPDKQAEVKSWWNIKNTTILITIIVFIVILAILAFSGLNLGVLFENWTKKYWITFGFIGLIIILFVISTFANMTVLFPIPYAAALAFVALNIPLTHAEIWVLGIIAGIGAAIGEITAYYIGKGSAILLESRDESESVRKMKDRIRRGWAVPLMFLCAATFIPDDPLLIMLGYARYPLWKMLVTYFFGKITLCVSTIYLSILARSMKGVKNFLWILGITPPGEPTVDPWISFVGWVGVLILFFIIFYIDWGTRFKWLYGKLFKSEETMKSNFFDLFGKNILSLKCLQKFEKFNY